LYPYVRPLPEIIQAVLVIFKAVAVPYCANVRVPVVPKPAKYIVSVVMAMLIEVADKLTKLIAVPIGYATEPLAGIVYVAAPAPEAW
jgi:hypothetical protein